MAQSIVARVADADSLSRAWKKIRSNVPGPRRGKVDSRGDSVNSIDENLRISLSEIAKALRSPLGYQFKSLVAYAIPKKEPNKYRIICVPSFRDRIVQRAVLNYLADGDHFGLENSISFGYVSDPEKSVAKAATLARQERKNHPWAYKTDITQFFDRIPRDALTDRISKLCRSKPLRELLRRALSCEIAKDSPASETIISSQGIKDGVGVRQGMPLSPLFANVVLRDFDRMMKKKNIRMIRYADDLIALADSYDECLRIHAFCEKELSKVKLTIPAVGPPGESKTQIAEPEQSIEFLGVSLERGPGGDGYILNIPKTCMDKMRDRIANFGDLSHLSSRGITIASIGRAISDQRDGWISAYSYCSNAAILKPSLHSWTSQAIQRLFTKDFKLDIANLSAPHRAFLLIP